MTRVQAADYGDKRNKILDAGAKLFARNGYAGTRMEEIAAACDVSKSMLYHYFKKKEDVLFAILQDHMMNLVSDFRRFLETADRSDKYQFFTEAVETFLTPKKKSRSSHVVALHDVRYLSRAQRKKQEVLEREFIVIWQELLGIVNPKLSEEECKIPTYLIIVMLNWVDLWYNRKGKLSPKEFFAIVVKLFLNGFLSFEEISEESMLGTP